jgi:hypothetical protein
MRLLLRRVRRRRTFFKKRKFFKKRNKLLKRGDGGEGVLQRPQ